MKQPATETAFKTETVFVIPARLSAPELTLSFVGEKLVAAEETTDMTTFEVSVDQKEWSSLETDASITKWVPEALADFKLYARSKATESDFVSLPKTWEIKGRQLPPHYTVNYADSTTNEVVAATVEYDTVNTFAALKRGEDAVLKLNPGTTYYFRKAASEEERLFVSPVDSLEVPAVTGIGNVRVNYAEEKLEGLNEFVVWKIDGGTETQAQEDISGIISPLADVTLTLYVPEGVGAFATVPYTIVLPKREAAPEYEINYADEVIFEPTDQLTPDNWEIKLPGEETYVKLDESGVLGSYIPAPGEGSKTIQLRTTAAVDAFHSEACEVVLNARPATPVVTVDFVNEKTKEIIPA